MPPPEKGILGNRIVSQVEGVVYIRAPSHLGCAYGAWPKHALTRGSRGLLLNVSGEKRAGLGSKSSLPQFNK